MKNHVTFSLNGTHVAVVNSNSSDIVSAWIMDTSDPGDPWTKLPTVPATAEKHRPFAGLVTRDDGVRQIIVGGGQYTGDFVTYILELDPLATQWRVLNRPLFGEIKVHSGVSVPWGDTFLAVCGIDENGDYSDKIFYFNTEASNERWVELSAKMTAGKSEHAAFLIPDNYYYPC